MDIFDSINNGIISALVKEFISLLFNYLVEHKKKEKIFFAIRKILRIRDYNKESNSSNNHHPNTPFTFNGQQFVAHL